MALTSSQISVRAVTMEDFCNVGGLNHIAEGIFQQLSFQDWLKCRKVCKAFYFFIENQSFFWRGVLWQELCLLSDWLRYNVNWVEIIIFFKDNAKVKDMKKVATLLKDFKRTLHQEVKDLLKHQGPESGQFLTQYYKRNTPLHYASKIGDFEAVQLLTPFLLNKNPKDQFRFIIL